ncbi:unnamed protein product [Mucor hiemalis]
MGSLAGLVNYSDDEDSSSSGDEQVSAILTKKIEKQKVNKPAVVLTSTKPTVEPSTSGSTAPTAIPTITMPTEVRPPPGINEHHRRLMSALAAKPIEGVDNWAYQKSLLLLAMLKEQRGLPTFYS